jgi:hypothetical protein
MNTSHFQASAFCINPFLRVSTLAMENPNPEALTLFTDASGQGWQLILLQRVLRFSKRLFSLLSALNCRLSSWPAVICPLRPLMFIQAVPVSQDYCVPLKLPISAITIMGNYLICFASCGLSYKLATISTFGTLALPLRSSGSSCWGQPKCRRIGFSLSPYRTC